MNNLDDLARLTSQIIALDIAPEDLASEINTASTCRRIDLVDGRVVLSDDGICYSYDADVIHQQCMEQLEQDLGTRPGIAALRGHPDLPIYKKMAVAFAVANWITTGQAAKDLLEHRGLSAMIDIEGWTAAILELLDASELRPCHLSEDRTLPLFSIAMTGQNPQPDKSYGLSIGKDGLPIIARHNAMVHYDADMISAWDMAVGKTIARHSSAEELELLLPQAVRKFVAEHHDEIAERFYQELDRQVLEWLKSGSAARALVRAVDQ